MFGGYGGGLGGMYGSGMGSMYGGGMYGSGMGSMYGGGMYGSGMDSMYGGGLGMMSGFMRQGNQYTSGLGNRGLSSSSAFNAGGDGIQGNLSGQSGALSQPGPAGGSSPASGGGYLLAPSDSTNATSPVRSGIPLCGAPPPLQESPEEKAKRLREEARHEREVLRQKKERREQLRRQARVEIAGHVTNVLAQTLRTVLEVCTVCFGSYYSIKAFQQMGQMPQMIQNGRGMIAPVPGGVKAVSRTVLESKKSGRGWKFWVVISAFLLLAELLYHKLFQQREPKAITQEKSHSEELLSSDEESEDNDRLSSDFKDAWTNARSEKGRYQRTFVALHDYESADGEGYLNFKAGDKFLVEDFCENKWCVARRIDADGAMPSCSLVGYVPSNYLRSTEEFTKL